MENGWIVGYHWMTRYPIRTHAASTGHKGISIWAISVLKNTLSPKNLRTMLGS